MDYCPNLTNAIIQYSIINNTVFSKMVAIEIL